MINEKTLNLFENYLNCEMNAEQIVNFEKMIKSDKELSESFSDYKSAKTAVTVLSREKLRKNLSKIFRDEQSQLSKPKRKFYLKKILNDVFDEFFLPFENVLTVRSSAGKNEELQEAMSFYSKGDYKNASLIFKQLLKKNPDDLIIYFYYGISELVLEKYDNSKKIFKKIIQHDKDLLKDLARWYLGLAYLKSGDTKSARKYFESLTNKSSFYDSEKILQKIKSL